VFEDGRRRLDAPSHPCEHRPTGEDAGSVDGLAQCLQVVAGAPCIERHEGHAGRGADPYQGATGGLGVLDPVPLGDGHDAGTAGDAGQQRLEFVVEMGGAQGQQHDDVTVERVQRQAGGDAVETVDDAGGVEVVAIDGVEGLDGHGRAGDVLRAGADAGERGHEGRLARRLRADEHDRPRIGCGAHQQTHTSSQQDRSSR
jgi:hypothetical protein